MPRIALVIFLMLGSSVLTVPAFAECKRLGFAVNDYGKEGPTRDAKRLLDIYQHQVTESDFEQETIPPFPEDELSGARTNTWRTAGMQIYANWLDGIARS